MRLERTRQFGACWLGLELWKRLDLDRFFEQAVDARRRIVPTCFCSRRIRWTMRANIARRAGVMVRGRWIPEYEIQAKLAEIAAANRRAN